MTYKISELNLDKVVKFRSGYIIGNSLWDLLFLSDEAVVWFKLWYKGRFFPKVLRVDTYKQANKIQAILEKE